MIDTAMFEPLTDAKFRFACHTGLPCFTKCCADLDLVLTPYDILRLKNRLGMPSETFLDRYTTVSAEGATGLPVVRLGMRRDQTRRCPFVDPQGCRVYQDRPAACRCYPLARAAVKIRADNSVKAHYFLVKEAHCLGLGADHEWTVQEWLTDQGLDEYNTMNDFFLEISPTRPVEGPRTFSNRQLQMYYMACYNLDIFRRFVVESSFRDRFEIAPDLLNRIQTDEVELMVFACRWLKFSLFGEKTFQIKGQTAGGPMDGA